MLGCIQPMSSPMMNRMLGLASSCACDRSQPIRSRDRPEASSAAVHSCCLPIVPRRLPVVAVSSFSSCCRRCVAFGARRRIQARRRGSAVVGSRTASARAVEDPEDLRLEFVQYPAVVLRPRCSGRSGPLPVSKRLQRLAVVLADLLELRVASVLPMYLQLALREPSHDGGDTLTPSLLRTCSPRQRGSLQGRIIALKSARRKVRNMYATCAHIVLTATWGRAEG